MAEEYEEYEEEIIDSESYEEEIIEEEIIEEENPPAPPRPVHPLFGGGGGSKSALNDQIKMMANKRNARVEKEGPKEPPKPVASPNKPAPLRPSGGPSNARGGATASLADQVAMMAARRSKQREDQGVAPVASKTDMVQQANAPTTSSTKITTDPVKKKPVVIKTVPAKTSTVKTWTKPATSPPAPEPAPEPAKKGFFGKKSASPSPAPPAAPKARVIVRPTPQPEPKKTPEFTQARLKPVQKPDADSSKSAGKNVVLGPGGLRSTGKKLDEPPKQILIEKANEPEPEPEPEPKKVERAPAPTTTVTKTKRVTEPEYEVTEYKIGCVCTIL